MKTPVEQALELYGSLMGCVEKFSDINLKFIKATTEQVRAVQTYWNGVFKYLSDFTEPSWNALESIGGGAKEKLAQAPPWEVLRDYVELLQFNLEIVKKGLTGSLVAMNNYHAREATRAFSAWLATVFGREGEDLAAYTAGQAKLLELVVHAYPEAIREIEPEYGLHLEGEGYIKTAETERYELYRVLPLDKKVKVREKGKPIIIIPPYVLGANILAFLPGEKKSYVHCFADQGIPTYIRIVKDIDRTPAVQVMTGEDDALDTRFFCEQVMAKHERPVTLNGYCQGGFNAVVNLLSGELDGLVDALITCVAPMDGTRSKSLARYLEDVPDRFRDQIYGLKTLPNGNQVVDGKIMSWVYKLRSIEKDAPLVAFYRDLLMFEKPEGQEVRISKTAAAINYYLIYDRTDIPAVISQMSFDSYTIPITKEGTLPVKLFDRTLNLKRLEEMGIKWLICYGERDDLVDKEDALAPLDYVNAEVTPFPKGHLAMATSWSHPDSDCALHTTFGDSFRGPVRYQLDLEA